MRPSLRRLRIRDAALFAIVAGLVAVVVVIAGREAGLGGRAGADVEPAASEPQALPQEQPAGQEEPAEPLTLSLDGPEICETGPGWGGSASRVNPRTMERYDEYLGVIEVGEIPVRWATTGGTPPYRIEIDGEARDAQQAYHGPSGTASVSCALRLGDVEYVDHQGEKFRRYKGDVLIDSGSKTVRGVVTDSLGRTATAEVQIYVIKQLLARDRHLKAGHTYRLYGQLVTAPTGASTSLGAYSIAECQEDHNCESEAIDLHFDGPGFHIIVSLGLETGRAIEPFIRYHPSYAATDAPTLQRQAEALLAVFIDSINKLPTLEAQE